MNGVLGLLDLALHADLPPDQREHISDARDSAHSLLRLLNDLYPDKEPTPGQMLKVVE